VALRPHLSAGLPLSRTLLASDISPSPNQDLRVFRQSGPPGRPSWPTDEENALPLQPFLLPPSPLMSVDEYLEPAGNVSR
jgi:hypothetical protein